MEKCEGRDFQGSLVQVIENAQLLTVNWSPNSLGGIRLPVVLSETPEA